MDFKDTKAILENVVATYSGSYSQGLKLEGGTEVTIKGENSKFSSSAENWMYGISNFLARFLMF